MTDVRLINLEKVYDGCKEPSVRNLSLDIKAGELVALLGPSGCGKTTTLKMVGGLHEVTRGEVLFNGQLVNNIKPEKREAVMVYQNYLLFPYMTIEENIGFGLKMRHVDRDEIKERVKEMLKLVKLEGFEKENLPSFPADRSSGLLWPGLLSSGRKYFFWMNLFPIWMLICGMKCGR